MRKSVVWTESLDTRLRTLREEGLTWDAVAAAMDLGRNTVLERARRTGARIRRQPAPVVPDEPRDRPARQAGHPLTWGLLTAGTVLDGERYPFPVFL